MTMNNIFVDVGRVMHVAAPPPPPGERRAGEHVIRTTLHAFGASGVGHLFTLRVCDHCRTLIVQHPDGTETIRRFVSPEGEVLERLPPVCFPPAPRRAFGGGAL